MDDKDVSDVSLLFAWVIIFGIFYALWKTILFIYNIFRECVVHPGEQRIGPRAIQTPTFIIPASIPLKEINVITNSIMCDRVIEELKRRSYFNSAIGFDCEWVPTYLKNEERNRVVLIQLASSDGFCGLFRLNHMEAVPDSLVELLENECIYKVGVETIRDAMYLYKDYGINTCSALDLRHIAEMCGYDPRGLAFLSKKILNVELEKHKFIICSDWEAEELHESQIMYAAADAQVSVKIFDRLKAKLRIRFTKREVESKCNDFKDKGFKYYNPFDKYNLSKIR